MNDQPELAAIEVLPGERWTHVLTLDQDGPYVALVHDDPQRGLVALLPRATVDEMTRDLDPAFDIYGGLRWSDHDHDTLLIYQDADDPQPRPVQPDERGLYDLDTDWDEVAQ